MPILDSELNRTVDKINLLGLNRSDLEALFAEMGEKSFRASQVMKWLYQDGVHDFSEMTNLSKALREKLAGNAEVTLPEVVEDHPSVDGTRKWLFKLDGDNSIETVFIPEDGRGTLCISSQVGCTLACTFCSTARQGFNRNLTAAEIVGQIVLAAKLLGWPETQSDRKITNVVLMGMGEPLLNFEPVITAMDIMQDDFSFGLSKRRITLSTSGVVPMIRELRKVSDVSLAISLHASNDKLRDQLVPINQKYPIAELLSACLDYVKGKAGRTRITFEYVMLAGINDSDADARALAKLLKNVPSKVNLIPFNPFPGSPYQCSSMNRINRFRDIVHNAGITTVTRKTRGDDIAAACGQLVGEVNDRTRRSGRFEISKEKEAS